MVGFATYGLALFVVLLLAGWWTARRGGPHTMAAALWAGAGTLVAVGVNQPIVTYNAEKRPYVVLPHSLLLVGRSADFSYPSDHAVMAGAVAIGLLLVSVRLGLLALLAALVMAFARVYVGAHWPADVIAGLIVGSAVVLLGEVVFHAPLTRLVDRLERTPLRLLLTATPARIHSCPDAPGAVPVRETREHLS